MKIGVPSEVKNNEPPRRHHARGVAELVAHGHEVLIQNGARRGQCHRRCRFCRPGCPRIIDAADDVRGEADLVMKVGGNRLPRSTTAFGPA